MDLLLRQRPQSAFPGELRTFSLNTRCRLGFLEWEVLGQIRMAVRLFLCSARTGDPAVGKTALAQIFRSDGAHFQKNYTLVRRRGLQTLGDNPEPVAAVTTHSPLWDRPHWSFVTSAPPGSPGHRHLRWGCLLALVLVLPS